jgi:hypothetical protein
MRLGMWQPLAHLGDPPAQKIRAIIGHPMPKQVAFMAKLRAAFDDEATADTVQRGNVGDATFHGFKGNRISFFAKSSWAQ